MTTIGIGISTYNDSAMTHNLINSIKVNTPGECDKDYKLVVVDDGTKNASITDGLENVICRGNSVIYFRNSENRGIPATWNKIVQICNTDIVIIFNNDILVINPNWLKCIEYFLTQNDKIGTVGFPLIQAGQPYDERSWGEKPGRVGAAVGCCFGFKKDVWQQVKNPDGSTGFWEDLISFHEETHFGFKLSEMGYYNYMLNFPPMIHAGGQTFQRNPELIERPIDWSRYNKDEYVNIIMKSPIYPESWKRNNKIAWRNSQGIEMVDRMAFSRYMFAKYWSVLDSYNAPQIPVHRKVVDPMPGKNVKWLDKYLNERWDET